MTTLRKPWGMSRAPLAVAALVVVATAMAATGLAAPGPPTASQQSPAVGPSPDTTRVLRLTSADAAAFGTPALSVTGTLAAGATGISTAYRLERLDTALSVANTDAERRARIRTELDWATNRTTALVQRERDARDAYAAGTITTTEFLTVVGSVHAAATRIEGFLGGPDDNRALYTLADSYSNLTTRISQVNTRLQTVQGPVRERLAAVVDGDRDAVRVHVTVGDGVMLATRDGDTYVRETVVPGNLDAATTADYGDPIAFIGATYPWTKNHSRGVSYSLLGQYAVLFSASHDHGELSLYYDPSTTHVFVERQTRRLPQTPASYTTVNATDTTTLSVSEPYAGGPVNVRVETASGTPVDTTISVNGTVVGTTGDSGDRWFVSPAGEYTVAATVGGDRVTTTVTADPHPPAPGGNTTTTLPR